MARGSKRDRSTSTSSRRSRRRSRYGSQSSRGRSRRPPRRTPSRARAPEVSEAPPRAAPVVARSSGEAQREAFPPLAALVDERMALRPLHQPVPDAGSFHFGSTSGVGVRLTEAIDPVLDARRSGREDREVHTPPSKSRGMLDFTPLGSSDSDHRELVWQWLYWLEGHSFPSLTGMQRDSIERLISIGCLNPGLLAHYKSDELESMLCDGSEGSHRALIRDHRVSCLVFVRRIQALAVSDVAHVGQRSRTPPPRDSSSRFERMCDSLRHGLRSSRSRRAGSGDGIHRDIDDSDEDDELFDLSKVLVQVFGGLIPNDCFPDSKRLTALHKHVTKSHSKSLARPGVLASIPFDEWIPTWVGAGANSEDRKAAIKSYSSGVGTSCPRALGCISNFWLAHSAVGLCSPLAVFGHMLLFNRLCCERDLQYALSYERKFVLKALFFIKSGNSFSLDSSLVSEDSGISVILNADWTARKASSPSQKGTKGAEKGSKGAGKLKDSAALKGKGTGKSPSKVLPVYTRRLPVCFSHHPASGTTCNDASCQKQHLDTKDASQLERFNRARAAFDSAQANVAKPSSSVPAKDGKPSGKKDE